MVNPRTAGQWQSALPNEIAAMPFRSYLEEGNVRQRGSRIMSTATLKATGPRARFALALVGALLVAGTCGLWAFYGTDVFFEIVRTGWAMCF